MTDQNENNIEGFLLVNKPTGLPSYYCIKKIKHLLEIKTKIGHAGTLDAFATGLLIVAIGRAATRHISQIMELDKWYTATGKLGQLTDTLDFTGSLIEDEETDITSEQIKKAIAELGNQYRQVPPIYSALKYKGRSLSELARQEKLPQEELEKITQKKARVVNIYSCELLSLDLPYFTIEAHVSQGTYIRILLDDIAKKCGTHATTHGLNRSKIGPFSVTDATDLNDFKSLEVVQQQLIPIDKILKIVETYSMP